MDKTFWPGLCPAPGWGGGRPYPIALSLDAFGLSIWGLWRFASYVHFWLRDYMLR